MYTPRYIYIHGFYIGGKYMTIYICGGGGIVGKHVWVTVVACTCMLS